ncbi:hypothetical protein ACG1VR_22390 [Cedecea davisae]|uniref:Uncharacterized protein n=1 Tax=Cedecea davisae DSM 4568 TaxID=566551 RepID=S3JHQ1_9ENTR|nr:hypothetical protein [Cedecea davisae]EPF12674.1 hypothetical protein HMPREF0201_04784 [Cedecea davisae DSM 4568]
MNKNTITLSVKEQLSVPVNKTTLADVGESFWLHPELTDQTR